MIYLDTSAVAKLALPEMESEVLARWVNQHSETALVTSALTQIELSRAAMRAGLAPGDLDALSQFAFLPIDSRVVAIASQLAPPTLRSLDAIHLASATVLREDLTQFVTYDHRQAHAATELGLPVIAPGQAS